MRWLRFIKEFFQRLYRHRFMISSMTVRSLRARYINSLCGFMWAVVEPLGELTIYGLVFGVFLKQTPDAIFGTESFFLYLLCGLIPFQFFTQTMHMSTTSIVYKPDLVKKAVGFPSEVLPMVTVLTNLVNHFIGMALMFAIVFALNGGLSPYAPMAFVYLFFLFIMCIGLAWALSSLNAYFKDVEAVMRLAMAAWFFFTPVFYSPSFIPEPLMPIMKLNPLYHVVVGYRYSLMAGRLIPAGDFAYLAIVSLSCFVLGGMIFRKLKPGFAEVL